MIPTLTNEQHIATHDTHPYEHNVGVRCRNLLKPKAKTNFQHRTPTLYYYSYMLANLMKEAYGTDSKTIDVYYSYLLECAANFRECENAMTWAREIKGAVSVYRKVHHLHSLPHQSAPKSDHELCSEILKQVIK